MLKTVEVIHYMVYVGEEVLADLRERQARTRWPDQIPGTGWDYGTELGWLREVLAAWRAFDWRDAERRLNVLHHYQARMDGLTVHFVHERGVGPDPLPLVLTHGWPSTFLEYLDLISLLTDPGAHGADPADAFDVVVPDLPGYGFSSRPAVPGVTGMVIADLWARLMTEGLGFARFGAQGSDIGAGVTARLGARHPDRLVGIHMSAIGLPEPPPPRSAAEDRYIAHVESWRAAEGAYSHQHSTKPQTVSYGLTDSPAGLAAWVGEKWRAWSDSGGDLFGRVPLERFLATLTVYWATATIGSSMRPYYEYRHHGGATAFGEPITPPAGFALFPNEHVPLPNPPRELAERYFNVTRWTELPRGGHFPAIEEPELLARELREFFRPLR